MVFHSVDTSSPERMVDPSSVPSFPVDPAPLTKFQQISLKCQPLMLYVVSFAQFIDIGLLEGEIKLGDLFGHRRVFLSGLLWFAIFSLLNGFSTSPVMLCISRALQGIGAAAQIPTALALIAIKYPVGEARTRALSIFSAIGGMGAVTGLLLSGALTSTIGWQWIFYISAIMSSILFVFGFFAIPDVRGLHGESPKVDVGGAVTVTGGIVCIIYYISSGVEAGWASVQTLPVLCVGIVLLGIFFVIEKRISYPIMPFHIWKHRAFAVSFILIFIMQAAFQGFLYYSTLIFQEVLGYSIMRTSLSYLVHGLSAIVVYSVMGNFLPRLPLKPIIATGFVLLGCSALMFAFVTSASVYWILPFLGLIVNVFGLGFVMLPAQITALRDAADDDQGVVGAIYNVGLQIGAPFGLAILTVISGNLNNEYKETPGPERMHGYKYALIGDMVIALIGFVLTVFFLPHVKPTKAQKPASLEEGGLPVINDDDTITETDVKVTAASAAVGYGMPQKQELDEMHQKEELFQSNDYKQEISEEEAKAAAKVQLA
ncbi:hypothetical protein BG011_007560 [Mortierella polycephala]|uniref:Major facilitator superfamily (MFS) profile domain-containing protein n=1 Tax=Mortierella polycephala TaxID=41804 RepID=A0A9P6PSC8_9FUNG|nr:hypothetical protein BG011_007560 [Mortierella polycephala]